jgi:hypothetical protein
MGRNQRIAFLLVAAVIAVVAVVLIGGSSEDEPESASAPATQTAEPEGTSQPEELEPREEDAAQATPTATPEPELVEFRQGKVVGGLKKLRFDKGETVKFGVASDVDEEIHVHGYDVIRRLQAGKVARFSFKADIEGIFEIELHDRGLQLAQLRVEP